MEGSRNLTGSEDVSGGWQHYNQEVRSASVVWGWGGVVQAGIPSAVTAHHSCFHPLVTVRTPVRANPGLKALLW